MSAHKNIDRICIIITALSLVIALVFCNGKALGIGTTAHAAGYENRLFDHSKVHTIDIVINDWDKFIETCESEVYSACNVIIDGEAVKNVGIRGKGNTSLSSVKNMDSSRYSFKIEFDQYENGKTYHGLDKLCLNNIIQDNTYMKDYIAYTLMNDFNVDSPLCSYAYITVNGDDWGLYLAVEAIEDSFLERNYGSNYGELYKPDSMSFGGGGPGNGKDFSMTDFMNENSDKSEDSENSSENNSEDSTESFKNKDMPDFGGNMPDFDGEMPDFSDFDPSEMFGGDMPDFGGGEGGFGGGFGRGSDDVKLKYIDDDIDSYTNIFNNTKTDANYADKKRLIKSLKALSEQSDLENTLDIEEVIRYFVVHNYLCNGDSYTGQMIHNYYLYEENGQLSMIPWDYNLGFGSFQGGSASSSVNSPIDTPVSGDMSDRPMVSWIFDNEEYTEIYHKLFSEFIESTDFSKLVSDTAELIDEYVEKDPTKFCTYEEFEKGVETMKQFCTLRAESVKGQLDGSVSSTSDGQKADSSALIDTGDLDTSDMGSMNNGGFGGGNMPSFGKDSESSVYQTGNLKFLNNDSAPDMPNGFDPNNMPDDFDSSQFGGNMPNGFDPNNMPDDFDPSQFGGNMPDSKNDNSSENSETEEISTDSGSEEKTNGNFERPEKSGERPQMNDFPMNGSSQQDNTTEYILLGISALVLLLGLGFAFKFKR